MRSGPGGVLHRARGRAELVPERRVKPGSQASAFRALVGLAVLVLVGACSAGRTGDGSLRSVVAEGLRADPDPGEVTFTEDEATCVADRVVDQLGEDRLLDLGADRTPLDELAFDDGETRQVFTTVDACVDLVGQIAAFVAADGQVPGDVATCVAERYADSAELREAMFGGDVDPELQARIDAVLDAAFEACAAVGPA